MTSSGHRSPSKQQQSSNNNNNNNNNSNGTNKLLSGGLQQPVPPSSHRRKSSTRNSFEDGSGGAADYSVITTSSDNSSHQPISSSLNNSNRSLRLKPSNNNQSAADYLADAEAILHNSLISPRSSNTSNNLHYPLKSPRRVPPPPPPRRLSSSNNSAAAAAILLQSTSSSSLPTSSYQRVSSSGGSTPASYSPSNRKNDEGQQIILLASSEATSDTVKVSPSKSLDDDDFDVYPATQRRSWWCVGQFFKSTRYKGLKVTQILCAAYILLMTFRYYPDGLIDPSAPLGQWRIVDVWNPANTAAGVIQLNGDPFGPKRAIVAKDRISLICLAISRISAFTMYPCIFLAFMTKCKATINFLMTTPFSLYMVHDQHELHSFCGKFLAIDVFVHTFFHCLRWGLQGNIDLLWTNITGISGRVALLACVLVCLPMMVQRLRQLMSYEVRKFLHITFFYIFAIAMCFHNKTSAWPNGGYNQVILGFCIVYYTLDAAYVMFFMTEMIETTMFNVLPSGVQMTMAVSDNFQKTYAQGGYGYVCLPWVSKHQWHAFSLFEHPTNPNLRQVFMLNVGNWTSEVHAQLQRNTVRPAWIQGPFVSPYNNAPAFDNTICVATGIGITPALSVIRAHRESRRINLIWACRDVAMLEFFMDHLWLNNDGWILIFYTGRDELSSAITFNGNIKLIKCRPNLDTLIPNIIFGIETGQGVPESIPSEKAQVRETLARRVSELEEEGLSEDEIITELTFLAHERGFLLSNLVNETAGKYRSKSLLQVIKEQFSTYQVCGPTSPLGSSRSRGGSTRQRRRNDRQTAARAKMHRFHRDMCSGNTSKYCPWKEQPAAEEFVLGLDKKRVLNTWGIMYCGGSKSVESRLRKTSSKFDIKLLTESFAW